MAVFSGCRRYHHNRGPFRCTHNLAIFAVSKFRGWMNLASRSAAKPHDGLRPKGDIDWLSIKIRWFRRTHLDHGGLGRVRGMRLRHWTSRYSGNDVGLRRLGARRQLGDANTRRQIQATADDHQLADNAQRANGAEPLP
jgi:hypothetical protein